MTQWQVISLIALLAWLVLGLNGLRSTGVTRKRGVVIAFIWAGLFLVTTAVFAAFEH